MSSLLFFLFFPLFFLCVCVCVCVFVCVWCVCVCVWCVCVCVCVCVCMFGCGIGVHGMVVVGEWSGGRDGMELSLGSLDWSGGV